MRHNSKRWFLLLAAALMPMAAGAQCDISLPWSENFDSYTVTGGVTMPDCWTRVVPFQASATAQYPNLFTAYNHGTVMNFMGQGTAAAGVMKIATPLIPASLNQIEISFDVYKSGLMVYLATDTADESTYVLVGTYSPGYVWTTYEVRTDTLAGAPEESGYIVFASNYGSSGYGTAYLDNLTVVSLNNCERPTTVTVENIGPDGATVSWPAVDGVESYLLSFSTEDDLEAAEYVTVTGTSHELEDLLPGTLYYVWVRSACSDAYSDARSTTFTTQQACYSLLGFAQTGSTFDAASFSWEYSTMGFASTGIMAVLHDLTNTTIDDVVTTLEAGTTSYIFADLDNTHEYEVTLYTICGDDTASAVSSGIYFRSCGESPLSNGGYDKSTTCPIAPGYDGSTSMMLYESDILFSMDTIHGIALHRSTSGSAVTRTLNIYMGHTVLDSLTSNPGTNGMQQVATNHQYTLGVQEWDTLLFDSPFVFNGGSNVLVAINDITGTHEGGSPVEWYWHNAETKTYYSTIWNGSASSFSNYNRPDIRFVGQCNNEMSCNPPVVAVSEVDSVQAVVSWYGPIATDYIVQYRPQGDVAWITVDTIDDFSYTLTGLQSALYYEVRVGIVCDTVVRYSSAVGFETSCALMHLPFHFTQSNMSTVTEHGNSFSSCWNFSQYIYKGKLTNSRRGYVRNVDHNQWIMLPAIAEPVSSTRLRTWAASSDHGYFAVGVVENGDISTAVWLDTIEVNASNPDVSHDEYICYLDQYTGTGNRIVIQPIVNNDFHYMYFFDFHIEEITECMPVRNLTLDSVSASTLSFHWTPRGDATSWIVYVDGDSVDVVNDEPYYTAIGLQPYTLYNISVSSMCGTDDLSTPLAEEFRTSCEGDECMLTLVGHAAEGDGWHGSHLYLKSNGEEVENFTMLLGSDLSREVRVCQSATISLTWVSINDAEVCSFVLLNGNGDTVYSFADGSEVDDGELLVTDSICTYDPTNVPSCSDRYEVLVEEVCDSYAWRGQTLTASGQYADTVVDAIEGGCDSIFSLSLTVNYSVSQTIDTSAADSFVWNGTIYTVSGNYSFEGQTAEGCDSTVMLNLIITHAGCDNIYDTVVATACNSYDWRGTTYTASGSYNNIVAGAVEDGCDSILVLMLTVNYNIEENEAATECDSYTWRGQTFTTSGTYSDVVTGATAEGCDSIFHLSLVVNNSVSRTEEITASDSYTWNGQTYSQSGTYEWHGQTAEGCDSTVTLVLTITQGIDDVEAQMVSLYPNPTTGKVKIVADGVEQIEVYDAVGRRVVSTTNDNVDLTAMADGTYTLRIVTADGVAVRRVMKY